MRTKFSLTLNFGEEDEPLLTFLHKFPKDQWESILKDALQAYSEHSKFAKNLPEKEQDYIPQRSWNLDDLFVSPSSVALKTTNALSGTRDEGTDKPSKSPEDMPNSTEHNPLGHLFGLIGQEEDEEVLEFFLRSTSPSQSESGKTENHLEKKENFESEESMKFLDSTNIIHQGDQGKAVFKGLDFLLNQVIGEEDDPEVLDFFENADNKDKKV